MVHVLGLGPGSKSYILPVTTSIIAQSQVIIGARRNLASLELTDKYQIELKSNFGEIKEYLLLNKDLLKIAVVVSGDTGFYSLLNYLKSFLGNEDINVVPGISSLQYMYARLGMSYHNAYLTSLHGRNNDILNLIKDYESVGLLTDKNSSPASIANRLFENQNTEYWLYIGEELSYPDEKLVRLSVEDALNYKTDKINVVVIEPFRKV